MKTDYRGVVAMEIEKKVKEDMRTLGCTSETKIELAFYLYLLLVDEKLMYDSEYCYNKDIDTLYIVGRPSKNEKINIYIPLPGDVDITLDLMNKLQENLCTVETGPSINLALIEGDFTTVIYTLTKDIAEKPSPDEAAEQKRKEERRAYTNNELRKNRINILNNALNGGFVDDDDCEVIE